MTSHTTRPNTNIHCFEHLRLRLIMTAFWHSWPTLDPSFLITEP